MKILRIFETSVTSLDSISKVLITASVMLIGCSTSNNTATVPGEEGSLIASATPRIAGLYQTTPAGNATESYMFYTTNGSALSYTLNETMNCFDTIEYVVSPTSSDGNNYVVTEVNELKVDMETEEGVDENIQVLIRSAEALSVSYLLADQTVEFTWPVADGIAREDLNICTDI